MQCTRPYILEIKGVSQEVPCGRCAGCRQARARDWATRCVHEAAYWEASAFTTLTYCDEALPSGGSLDQDEFVRFWKRLRKALGKRRIAYYACGEYGERFGRPHYHALVFGLRPCTCDARRVTPGDYCNCVDRRMVMDCWSHGGVDRLGKVEYDSARYVADYVGKSYHFGNLVKRFGSRQRPFQVMSKGIGRRFVLQHALQIAENKSLTIHGAHVGLPRYYVHVMEKEVWNLYESRYLAVSDELKEYRKVKGSGKLLGEVPPGSQVDSKRRWKAGEKLVLPPRRVAELEASRLQREREAEAKAQLFKKGSI